MAPSFSSLGQAVAFALILLALLLSPWLAGPSSLPPRDQIYSSISWRAGSFPYIHDQIFNEKGDIDIAFLGSSHMLNDIDTPYVQQQLSEKLGHPATVVSLCWVNPGFDTSYFIARDLLQHRKVHTIVFYDDRGTDQPHLSGWRWVRFGDDGPDLAGLPWGSRIQYYYGAILGMPRNLLNAIRSNVDLTAPEELFYNRYQNASYPPDRLGSFTSQVAFSERPDLFRAYTPATPATASDVCVYSPETQDQFKFSEAPLPLLQTYFARKFLALAQDHGTQLVCLNLPVLADRQDAKIAEGRLWLEVFRPDAALMGIAPALLFKGLTEDEMHLLYQDPVHLNQNGQAYFTRLITPQLIELYEQTKP